MCAQRRVAFAHGSPPLKSGGNKLPHGSAAPTDAPKGASSRRFGHIGRGEMSGSNAGIIKNVSFRLDSAGVTGWPLSILVRARRDA